MTLAQTPALIRKDSHWAPWEVTVRSPKYSHASQLQEHPWAEITKLTTQCNFFGEFYFLLPQNPWGEIVTSLS